MPRARVLFPGPGRQVNGLQAVPEGLWLCDQVDNRVYLVGYEDGRVLASFDTPARNMSGIAFGGGSVWVAHNRRPALVYRFNPANGHGLAAVTLPRPDEGGVHGIEYAAGALWVTRPGLLTLQQLDPESGELRHEIPFPARRSHGLYWDAGAIVCVETNNRVVYRLDARTGAVLGQWVVEGMEPHGMTRDAAGRVWLCDATTNAIGVLE